MASWIMTTTDNTAPTPTGVVIHRPDASPEPSEPLERISFDQPALTMIQHAMSFSTLGIWAMEPDTAERMLLAGPTERDRNMVTEQKIARVPVLGPLTDRGTIFTELFGGVSYRGLTQTLQALDADPSIAAVVLEIDSSGGTLAGLDVAAQTIARMETRTIAVADGMMASAAYWLGSQADEVVALEGDGDIGSVGVFTTHVDASKLLARMGLKVTHISAGDGKIDGMSCQPLSESALAHVQTRVDEAYDRFVSRVVEGRTRAGAEVDRKDVVDEWGARVYGPARAVQLGMVDRLAESTDAVMRQVAAEVAVRQVSDSNRAARARRRNRLACGSI